MRFIFNKLRFINIIIFSFKNSIYNNRQIKFTFNFLK